MSYLILGGKGMLGRAVRELLVSKNIEFRSLDLPEFDLTRPGELESTLQEPFGAVLNCAAYTASKHAVEGMTKAMAVELGPHGIRVNTVCPTFIETPMTRPFLSDPTFRRDTLSKIKLGRLGQLEEVTGAIVFLASDASALMTGSAMVVDGGWTAE